jgi:hypothetical protein
MFISRETFKFVYCLSVKEIRADELHARCKTI